MNSIFSVFRFRTLKLSSFLLISFVLASAGRAQLVSATDDLAGEIDGGVDMRLYDFSEFEAFAGLAIKDVSVSVTFAKAADTTFSSPNFDEIRLSLVYINFPAFSETEVFLINESSFAPGADGASFTGTINFTDAAAQLVNHNPTGLEAGTFRPVESFSAIKGQAFDTGGWALFLEDTASGSPLIYQSSRLDVQFQPVPEPSTYGVAALLLVGGAIALRRRRRSTGPVLSM